MEFQGNVVVVIERSLRIALGYELGDRCLYVSKGFDIATLTWG
jgi:hypothetical protein